MNENSRFISDRRDPSDTTWVDNSDWKSGQAEGVEIINGQLVGQTTSGILYNEGENEENWIEGLTAGAPKSPSGGALTKEPDHLFVDPALNPNAVNGVSWVYENIVDFSGYTEVVIESASKELEGVVSVVITPELQYGNPKEFYSINGGNPYSRKTDTIDVSAISGEYYLHLAVWDNSLDGGNLAEAEFYYAGLR